jgi:hypothetical protein
MTPPIPGHPHPGKGQYRRAWTRCSHGHPSLEPDPRDPRGILRRCTTCARLRAQAAADAVNHAATLLSLRRVDYWTVSSLVDRQLILPGSADRRNVYGIDTTSVHR